MTKADSLFLVLATSAQVNLVILDDILLNNEYYNVNIYSEKCCVMWCCKCQKYHHIMSHHCWNRVQCDFCADVFSTNDCMIKNSDKSAVCDSCSCSNHSTLALDCSFQITKIIHVWETYTVWLIHYQEPALSSADLSSILKDLCDFCQSLS